MQITRSTVQTQKGPAGGFTGDVSIDAVAVPEAMSTCAAALVHFTPGARTAWHTHPHGQTIFVSEGIGLCQREGGTIEEIRPGDRVFFEPGESHWHGAAPDRFMVHMAMQPRKPVPRGLRAFEGASRLARRFLRHGTSFVVGDRGSRARVRRSP
jgi:quercetin dioxygenase-like cupin family protein